MGDVRMINVCCQKWLPPSPHHDDDDDVDDDDDDDADDDVDDDDDDDELELDTKQLPREICLQTVTV